MKKALSIISLLALTVPSKGAEIVPPLHIVALGDSTTAGTPFFRSPLEEPPEGRGNPEGAYAYWMIKMHPDWQVDNRGINGQRTDEIKARFRHDVISVKPRYVIILAGVNDIYQGQTLRDTEDDLLWMYQQAKSNNIIPIATSVLPFDRATEVQARKIRGLNRWIKHEAQTLNIPFCDTNAAVRDPKDPNRLKGSPEGLHPNIEGYRNMGETLAHLIDTLETKGGVTLTLQLTSPAFIQGSRIPRKYTCQGANVSPELNWTSTAKSGVQSFALIMTDPDAPEKTWTHWVIYNIPATERALAEQIPGEEALPNQTQQGLNDFGKIGYGGPCPPVGIHRYFFKLYALDSSLALPARSTSDDLLKAMEGHILDQAEIVGTCSPKEDHVEH